VPSTCTAQRHAAKKCGLGDDAGIWRYCAARLPSLAPEPDHERVVCCACH
jgi:hypothetical protein